jgi:SRSO17 transposase
MLERALDAGVPARWVVGDSVYGSDSKLRRALEERGQAYALAVKSTEQSTTWPPYGPPRQVAVAAIGAVLEPDRWQRLNCGNGAQAERLYGWARVPVRPALRDGWVHAVVIRRSISDPDELGYYLVHTPTDTPLAGIVRASGARWTIEEVFELAKQRVGLDEYEVCSWAGWHRHTILALLALAALVLGVAKRRPQSPLSARDFAGRRDAGAPGGGDGGPPTTRYYLVLAEKGPCWQRGEMGERGAGAGGPRDLAW